MLFIIKFNFKSVVFIADDDTFSHDSIFSVRFSTCQDPQQHLQERHESTILRYYLVDSVEISDFMIARFFLGKGIPGNFFNFFSCSIARSLLENLLENYKKFARKLPDATRYKMSTRFGTRRLPGKLTEQYMYVYRQKPTFKNI